MQFVRLFVLIGLLLSLTACWHGLQGNSNIVSDGQLTFAVIGDFGVDSAAEADVAALIASWNVDFVATVGDNNYSDGAAETIDKNIGKYYHQFISPYQGSFGSGATTNRFWPTLGNHDWESLSCTGETCSGPYFDYFQLPNNERYYDVVIGNVQLFILDSDSQESDGITADSKQAQWLKERLAASTATHKLVLLHRPPYSSGSVHGSKEKMQWPFEAWGATVVLAGHEHNYERLHIGGIPYFVNGLGGKETYPFGSPLAESQFRYNEDYGAMLVIVQDNTITYQFINRQGKLIDSFVQVSAKPPLE